ncbi:MAG: permease [Spirochaetota bacterium]
MLIKESSGPPGKKFLIPGKYLIVMAVIVLYIILDSVQIDYSLYDFSALYKLNLFFWGIFIQAFPFILSGALLSSSIQIFFNREKFDALAGSSGKASLLFPLIASFILPVCDCSSVTVAAGFVKKNLPLRSVIIYLLAAPIVNPIVIAATIFAFPGKTEMVIIRIAIGLLTAFIVALIMHRIFGGPNASYIRQSNHEHKICGCEHCAAEIKIALNMPLISKLRMLLLNTGDELFHVLPYIIAGSLISSMFQLWIPKSIIQSNSAFAGIFLQTGIMLSAAFLLSLCSTSDSFVARSFYGHFTAGPVLGFMILGPMIDVKNVIVLSSYFKKRFVAILTLLIFFTVYLLIILLSFLFKGLL